MANEFVKLAPIAEIPEGGVKVLAAGGIALAVCNVGGEIFAVDDLCTHDNGPLGEGEIVNTQIECPRHGARFDLRTGKAMCLPAVTPIHSYPVEIRGEDIWIEVPRK